MIVALIVAAIIVFTYISVGGLSAAIYNEVLQFFVIVAALLPLTLIGLHRTGGWSGLTRQITELANQAGTDPALQLNSWPGTLLSGFDSPVRGASSTLRELALITLPSTGMRTPS